MKTRNLLLALGCTAALTACTNNDEFNKAIAPETNMRTVTLSVDVNEPADTRVGYTQDGTTYKFKWTDTDQLRVFYNNGSEQVATFTIDDASISEDGRKADFMGSLPTDFTGNVSIVYAGLDLNYQSDSDNVLMLTGYPGQRNDVVDDLGRRTLLMASAEVTEAGVLPNVKLNHLLSYFLLKTNLQVTQDDLQISGAEDDPELQFAFNIPSTVSFSSTGYEVGEETGSVLGDIFVTDGQLDYYSLLPVFVGTAPKTQAVSMKGRLVYDDGDIIVESEVVSQPEFTYEPGKIYTVEAGNESWLPVNVQPIAPAAREPLTIEPVNSDINVVISNPLGLAIKYKIVGDDESSEMQSFESESINIGVQIGKRLQLFGDNAAYAKVESDGEIFTNIKSANGEFYVYGNIMSLINSDKFATATELTENNTFSNLFVNNGTYLMNHPENALLLPATTLTEDCYKNMFNGCFALTTAPELPALTMKKNCYWGMFTNCVSLTNVPDELPAQTLAVGCYGSMFSYCSSLETAPLLPATELVNVCYFGMFQNCTNLTSVTCLAENVSADNTSGFTLWMKNVSETGTFYHAKNVEWPDNTWTGVPEGWTQKNYGE